jgi:hypothetical protein
MDRRPLLGATHRRQVNSGVKIAASASNLKISELGIEGISQHRGGLSRAAKAQHADIPSFAGELVRFNARFASPFGGHPN